jgi:hypothetical protein
MHDLTAKRTLVKSPPELWSELSEVERLARHLGAFGEIRITKLEPEHTVAWEGEGASGTVSIEPSGWGTKVTLTAQVEGSPGATEEPEHEEPAAEEREVEEREVEEIEDPVVEEASVQDFEVEDFEVDEREPGEPTVAEPWPAVEESAGRADGRARRRRGLFGWLFRPRSSAQIAESQPGAPASEPVVEAPAVEEPAVEELLVEEEPPVEAVEPKVEEVEPQVEEVEPQVEGVEPEVEAVEPEVERFEPEPAGEPDLDVNPEGGLDPEANLDPEAGLDPEHAQAILDEALEALGSAHHRPFSRG